VISADIGVLASGCARLVRESWLEGSAEAVLDALVQVVGEVVERCEHASVTVVRDGRADTAAASGDAIRAFDAVQYDAGEGPCLAAMEDHHAVLVPDLRTDGRWPWLGEAEAAGLGFRSVLSVPVLAGHHALGSLNTASSRAQAFDAVSQQMLTVLASCAATLLVAAQDRARADQLQQQITQTRRRARELDKTRMRVVGEVRSGLMAIEAALQLLRNRREQLDSAGQEALDFLAEEVHWHQAVTLDLLRSELPPAREGGPARARSRSAQ
jgi:transcriptional regulator with GAF, ATPase, and Fis domain